MTNIYKYVGTIIVVAVVATAIGFLVGRSVGYERGVFESEIVSASTEALRVQELLKLLDASKTPDVQLRLNVYLDEKLIALDTLTRSPQMGGAKSSAEESLRQAIAYRKTHPFVNPGGPEISNRLQSILGAEGQQ